MIKKNYKCDVTRSLPPFFTPPSPLSNLLGPPPLERDVLYGRPLTLIVSYLLQRTVKLVCLALIKPNLCTGSSSNLVGVAGKQWRSNRGSAGSRNRGPRP